jgi:hypothetical protein
MRETAVILFQNLSILAFDTRGIRQGGSRGICRVSTACEVDVICAHKGVLCHIKIVASALAPSSGLLI